MVSNEDMLTQDASSYGKVGRVWSQTDLSKLSVLSLVFPFVFSISVCRVPGTAIGKAVIVSDSHDPTLVNPAA